MNILRKKFLFQFIVNCQLIDSYINALPVANWTFIAWDQIIMEYFGASQRKHMLDTRNTKSAPHFYKKKTSLCVLWARINIAHKTYTNKHTELYSNRWKRLGRRVYSTESSEFSHASTPFAMSITSFYIK